MDSQQVSSFYKGKQVLITGASGYIAWNLIKRLRQFDCQIIGMSRAGANVDAEVSGIPIIKSDYHDLAEFESAVQGIDVIYHLASQTSAYVAERDPLADYESNVRPMQLLLEACRITNTCPVIIFAGTSTQCGMPDKLPIGESIEDHPITVYDFHKLQAERWLKYYTGQGHVKGLSLRLTNVYGPGPKSSSSDRGVLNMMIKKALNGEDLTVYGKGEQIRDYIFIDDVTTAFLNAPIQIKKMNGCHCVLGSGQGTMIFDAVSMVAEFASKVAGRLVRVKRVEAPKGLLRIESRNFTADTRFLDKYQVISEYTGLAQGIEISILYAGGSND